MQAAIYLPLTEDDVEVKEESVARVVISQEDWNKINTTIDDAITAAIAPLLPRSGWRRVLEFLKLWGAISALWAVPLSLIAIAGSAVYVAVARVDKQARFEENTTNTLREINAHLKKIDTSNAIARLEHAISNPTDKSNALEAKGALYGAQQDSVQLSPSFIQKAGTELLR